MERPEYLPQSRGPTHLPHDMVDKLSCVWTDAGGQHWLLTFYLADIDGRNECIGFAVRSYVKRLRPLSGDPPESYEAYADGPVDTDELAAEAHHLGASSGEVSEIGEVQEAALADLPDGQYVHPVPLKSITLRQIPFFSLLNRTLADAAETMRMAADIVGSHGSGDTKEFFDWMATNVVEFAEWLVAEKSKPTSRRRGRRPKYTPEDLLRVATVYREAAAQGSRTPTKAVRDALGLTQSSAEKLVSRCRDKGLIPPAKPFRPSGQF